MRAVDKMLPDPPLTVSSVSHCLTSSTNLALPSVRVEFLRLSVGHCTTVWYHIGSAAERNATIRHGVSIMSALYHATMPIFTVILRRSFGVAGGALSDPGDGVNTRVAWWVCPSSVEYL